MPTLQPPLSKEELWVEVLTNALSTDLIAALLGVTRFDLGSLRGFAMDPFDGATARVADPAALRSSLFVYYPQHVEAYDAAWAIVVLRRMGKERL